MIRAGPGSNSSHQYCPFGAPFFPVPAKPIFPLGGGDGTPCETAPQLGDPPGAPPLPTDEAGAPYLFLARKIDI